VLFKPEIHDAVIYRDWRGKSGDCQMSGLCNYPLELADLTPMAI